ncbi:synaptotagmin [Acrasis kona]|uniref:Synaptotagmin n=1 Tax=Acrasis kona TaxID=1008807 RepID=A0AAW2YHX7_9EUKA
MVYQLKVHVFEAKELEVGHKILKKSNPYVVLSLRGQTFTTPVVKNTLHPKFNQSYTFDVYDPTIDDIIVDVYDKGGKFGGKDRLIGRARILLKDLTMGETLEKWYSLMAAQHGDIRIALFAVDFGRAPKTTIKVPGIRNSDFVYPSYIAHEYTIDQAVNMSSPRTTSLM